MNEEDKKIIIHDLNLKIGGDINELGRAYDLEKELLLRKDKLQSDLNIVNNEGPTKLSTAVKKAELNLKQIETLRIRNETLKEKDAQLNSFLNKTEPLRIELEKKFMAINKLEHVLLYLKSFEKIDELSRHLKQSNDDEQLVLLYGELKEMCRSYQKGHRATYVRDTTHYWHNVLKDKLSKHYEDVLKVLKWPIANGAEHSPPSKEAMVKFNNLTKYLFLIEEPEININSDSENNSQEKGPCLPVKILLQPLKKRFIFHFTGTRQTARVDRPEWFLTQTLTWIKDHQGFIKNNVQPIADKLELKNVKTVDEFNDGLILLAAERLHSVLALYHTQGSKGEIADVDAAFAHAVDETLGFHRELIIITGKDTNSVLSVLTKAEIFVRWLTVEKKYALSKMDESLSSAQWCESVGAGAGVAAGAGLWVPRAADWFVTLLRTIEDRYAVLPQPGHRLQFLELQLDLLEEWRVRLTQLLSAAIDSLHVDSFLATDSTSHPLTAVINAAHHTRNILLQWAHSLHYLQLHYYRRQFFHFTQQQHHDEESETSSSSDDEDDDDSDDENAKKSSKTDGENDEAISLTEVEDRAKKLAENEVSRRDSLIIELIQCDITTPIANLAVTDPVTGDAEAEEAGVFADAPALLARLRDAGLAALADHILLEFKAGLRDYKRQKWQSLLMVEEIALSVSGPLCRPLAALCARLSVAAQRLAPALAANLRTHLADMVDAYIFEEVVLESWFNTGGTVQFTHDVKRNIVPAFAPPNKLAMDINQMSRLVESCKLLNLDYDDARRLRALLVKQKEAAEENLANKGIHHIQPAQALRILNQRTDLSDSATPASVMELF